MCCLRLTRAIPRLSRDKKAKLAAKKRANASIQDEEEDMGAINEEELIVDEEDRQR